MEWILTALGELIELSRWGLPAGERVTADPNLLALIDEFDSTIDRLEHSFPHVADLDIGPVPSRTAFERDLAAGRDEAGTFGRLQQEARRASGLDATDPPEEAYRRFCEWLAFHRRTASVVRALRRALGYEGRR